MPESPLPAIVGGGQTVDRPQDLPDPRAGREPLALMADAARVAADDAGGGAALLRAIDTLGVVTNVFHDYGDTAGLLAERLGIAPARRMVTTWGGNTPQSLLNHLCDEIAAGRTQAALLVGGEAFQTMRALGRAGLQDDWTPARDTDAPRFGDMRQGTSELEARHGAREATVTYALVENAYRAARGLSLEAHRAELAEYGARCAAIAARNPYAWFRDAKDAATIGAVGPDNRMVAFPYPKYLNAILEVNQGAALILTTDAFADRHGLPRAKRVYPWAGADVTELWYLLDRVNYHELPGMRRAGQAVLETAGMPLERIRHLDLYSCFPIAARLSADMLGIRADDPRPLTTAGGLPYFGGAGNNYTTHAIAALVERLRDDRDSFALTHALGWNLTKHAFAVYGATPPPSGWHHVQGGALQAEIDAMPHPTVVEEANGAGTIEAYTVVHGRDGGPERGVVIGRLGGGERFIAELPVDRTVLDDLERCEGVGRPGRVRCDDGHNTFSPS